ncbi:KIR protein [Plasmodium coatneyi]|uniref:KIR protein n=1 Tax=Plasmodium coatneyi TaxID=208452 RepID=A0A1B1E6Z2_9APIC|nr:KIR protein [Plasmodium coatneyi]ANQ10710.1 KIR protein [Plasmodium coatneyi]
MAPGKATTLTKTELEGYLPSKKKYKELDESAWAGCGYNFKSDIENAIENFSNIKVKADTIKEAVDNICHMISSGKEVDESCDYFYFWLGDKIFDGVDDSTFKGAMKSIYDKVKGKAASFNCTNKYPTITIQEKDGHDGTLFQHMKKVHDYYRDYERITFHIKEHNYSCTHDVESYLGDINTSYEAMKIECPTEEGAKPYCRDFKSWFKNPEYKSLLERKCKAETAFGEKVIRQHAGSFAGQGSELLHNPGTAVEQPRSNDTLTSSSGNSIAAVSTILPTLGIGTFITFLLYKVIIIIEQCAYEM